MVVMSQRILTVLNSSGLVFFQRIHTVHVCFSEIADKENNRPTRRHVDSARWFYPLSDESCGLVFVETQLKHTRFLLSPTRLLLRFSSLMHVQACDCNKKHICFFGLFRSNWGVCRVGCFRHLQPILSMFRPVTIPLLFFLRTFVVRAA